ncbi:DNA topoisomerase I [Francisella persica ATCC VR-331]|uniref:DNA topoisomerase 1 n=1 Tax=Francisella persica ATCC VR-331 TaxID=1086726 RepID=A0AAC8VE35_9GAMM|nr:type I DNA topoisomerase [Francisella persica]ALB01931.1 DNA topoisomerase I [Francisella persica ATCC VR-331]ANH77185.1 DNA topoisomerase I [Francisella persica ATCC VR-331]
MAKNLVIVESPAKTKTIKKYIGSEFEILASFGHVREIPSKDTSIDVNDNFKIKFTISEKSKKHLDAIKKAAKGAQNIYLATDPDREGEAISWHVQEVLKSACLLKDKNVYRVTFNEITKSAVTNAIANPKELSMDLVDAQKARQALDFLVGFNLSPLLWRKITSGLSAGRVQSPALRMIVEREIEREKFVKQGYWSLRADTLKQKQIFANLIEFNNNKVEQFTFTTAEAADNAKASILKDANGFLIVDGITEKKTRRSPYPPFITSTLQQEASKKLGFTAKRTMSTAQKLYEGIDLGNGESVGLISYMRTDSTNLSNDAVDDIRNFIQAKYGKDMLPAKPRVFEKKSQNAQEAHEAIRVTSANKTPKSIKQFLTADEFKLYSLIYNRTIACQMKHATLNSTSVDLITKHAQHKFKVTGTVIVDAGFLKIYNVEKDEDDKDDNEEITLPKFEKGEKITLNDVIIKAHSTEPPPRYTEASLVQALEKYGIGRPSTYATIISTLQQREYVEVEKRRFIPTDKGRIVNKFLTEYFKKYVEYSYTAGLEKKLDDIAHHKNDYLSVLNNFWHPFIERINKISEDVSRKDVVQEKLDEDCPECGSKLSLRLGKNGRFIGCTNYPTCKYTRHIDIDNKEVDKEEPIVVEDRKCPKCSSDLHIKKSRYGKFIGCSNYPECKHMEPIEKPKDTGVVCPKCNKNHIVEKKSRKGKVFYACAGFPKCKNAYWYLPIKEECPKCHSPILLHKTTKKDGEQKACPNSECDYAVPFETK